MTTRITKQLNGNYVAQSQDKCQEAILTFQECYHAAAATLAAGNQKFVNTTGSDPSQPAGCSATTDVDTNTVNVFFNQLSTSNTECAAGAQTIAGVSASFVHTSLSLSGSAVSLTMSGPATVWFGVGFGARAMADQPWTIVVDGTGAVTEHKLQDQKPGTVLKPSVTVVSNVVKSGVRTVVVSRPLKGAGSDYYSFNMTAPDTTIPIINAVGSTSAFSYHKEKVCAMHSRIQLV